MFSTTMLLNREGKEACEMGRLEDVDYCATRMRSVLFLSLFSRVHSVAVQTSLSISLLMAS